MRVLCLHGLYQCKEVFKTKLAPISSTLKDSGQVEFLFADAPHRCTPAILLKQKKGVQSRSRPRHPAEPVDEGNYRGWWEVHKDLTTGTEKEMVELRQQQLRLSLLKIREMMAETSADGVLGFSQGASLASLLCTEQGMEAVQWSPRFAVLITGRPTELQPLWYTNVDQGIQSLHVWGLQDKVISPGRSEELSQQFNSPQIVTHQRGHVIPADKATQEVIAGFLESRAAV